jgi:hypothetical protein
MANPTAVPLLSDDPYALGVDALLVAEAASADLAEALAGAGMRLRARADFAAAPALLDEPGIGLVLLDARRVDAAVLTAFLAGFVDRDRAGAPSLVALCIAEQLDLAAPLLGMRRVQLLCDPEAAELCAALAIARSECAGPPRLSVQDITRDSESARLRRLNAEVARIADALARLTRGELAEEEEIERRGGIREPEMAYRGPEAPAPDIDPAEIRAVIRARRLRNQFFATDLFADPAWDMLLDLFAASLERRRVSVSSLCIAAAVPPTTALRWIGTMHEAGLFGREADPGDRRRAYIVLSEKAQQGMRAYIGALRRSGLGLV